MKRYLFIVSGSPYGSTHTIELLETAMVAAVFDAPTSVLFRGDGVWGLLPNQNAAALGLRTVGKVLDALPTYEVEDLYVCSESLATRGLASSTLAHNPKPLTPAEQAELIGDHDAVITAQG